jgi:hypothetical protein
MGGEPPQHEEEGDGRDERAIQARGHSVAQLLGEEWRTDGDGIYRLVAQSEASDGSTERAAERDAVDDLIAELTADLGQP